MKYEGVYLKGYVNSIEPMIELTECFVFYDSERPRQSLGNLTPNVVYAAANGGSARMVEDSVKIGQR